LGDAHATLTESLIFPARFLIFSTQIIPMRKVYTVSIFVFIILASCQTRSVSRIDPNKEIDLSGRWNDVDSRKVADQMIFELFESETFKSYSKALNRKPVVVIGTIKNKTSEHIDADNFIKKFEVVIHNSNVADVVESDEFRDKLRVERASQQDYAEVSKQFGKELGADVMLFGEMTSEVDTYNKRRVVNYITTLYLTDIETSKRIWYGQNEIKKFVKN
jgi:penicillin-binding protein activator